MSQYANKPEAHPTLVPGDPVILAARTWGDGLERRGTFVEAERQWLTDSLVVHIELGDGHGLWDENEDSSTGIWVGDHSIRPVED